ncbi:hypothetical protein [Paenibacillus sp. RC84]|uniref:hypothetical protein n=1 Tax=Paenibacillus sp. RC84 TaxID=3156252 RepID=UPI003510ED1C
MEQELMEQIWKFEQEIGHRPTRIKLNYDTYDSIVGAAQYVGVLEKGDITLAGIPVEVVRGQEEAYRLFGKDGILDDIDSLAYNAQGKDVTEESALEALHNKLRQSGYSPDQFNIKSAGYDPTTGTPVWIAVKN